MSRKDKSNKAEYNHNYYLANSATIKERARRRHVQNKVRSNARSKEWYHSNKLYALEYAKAYRDKHSKKLKAGLKDWRISHKVHLRIYRRTWYENNKLLKLSLNVKRRAIKNGALGQYFPEDIARLYANQGGLCVCGTTLFKYQIDHKVPLSRGGSNWPDNLQLLCQPCNGSKGSKTMDEWRPSCAS